MYSAKYPSPSCWRGALLAIMSPSLFRNSVSIVYIGLSKPVGVRQSGGHVQMGVARESTHAFAGAGCCASIELLSELLLRHVCGRIMRIPSEPGAKRGEAPIIYNDKKR